MPQSTISVTRKGFTLIELLVVITIIGILAAIALPNYIKAKDKAKEVQTKSAVKALQVAIERYHTDFEEYPLFLLGGDVEGWRVWHQRYDEANPNVEGANAWVRDPLIGYSYMDAYPVNPFVDDGTAVIRQTGNATGAGGTHQPGDGDPRFGFRGNTIGNGLENPMVFRNWYSDDSMNIETQRTLLATTGNNPAGLGFGTPQTTPEGAHYSMGGRRATKVENGATTVYTAYTHWPGNFFYRGFPERLLDRKGWTVWFPQAFIKAQTSRYIMGGYGSYTTEGADVARVEPNNYTGGATYYRLPPPWTGSDNLFRCTYGRTAGANGGLPELAGGGNNTQGPWLPPDRSPDYPGAFIYGAPDGYPDAIIITLVAGEEVQAY